MCICVSVFEPVLFYESSLKCFSHNNCFCICICNLYLHLCIILWKLFQAFQTQRLFSPLFLVVPSPFTGSIYWPPTSRRVNTSPLISKHFQAFAKPGIFGLNLFNCIEHLHFGKWGAGMCLMSKENLKVIWSISCFSNCTLDWFWTRSSSKLFKVCCKIFFGVSQTRRWPPAPVSDF